MDQNMCHVGVQSAATTWTRFFHGIGQNASTGLKKGNPFYQYFDVYLDPDPLGPIHVAAKGAKDDGGEEAAEKRTREEMDSFFRRSHERLYFVTGTEPTDVFVDVAHLGEDAQQGWPAMGKERENERLNLIEYTRYVSRLHPRSADDMKQLMRLQAGLLRHMQHELAESEKEVSNRVRGIESRLKGDYGERMDRANAELSTATMECTNLRQSLRDAERETEDLRRKLLDTDQRLRKEVNDLSGQQQKLQQQLADALRVSESLSEQLEEVTRARESEGKEAKEELERLAGKLEKEASARERAISELKMQKASAQAREKELLGSLSSMLVVGKVSLPTVPCYLPMSADIRTAQLPPLPDSVCQTYNVSVPPDTKVHLPVSGKGTPSLRPGSQVLAKKLSDSPAIVERVPGTVTKEMPCGATLKLPRAAWGGDGNMVDDEPEEYEDSGTKVAVPIGSVITLPVTHRILQPSDDGDEDDNGTEGGGEVSMGADEKGATQLERDDDKSSSVPASKGGVSLSAMSYRLRAVTVPSGSLVILPAAKVHPSVNRYSLQLPRLSVLKLPTSEILPSSEVELDENGHAVVEMMSLTAVEVGQRFGVKEDEGGFVSLDLKPASVIVATGAASLELKLPEGSTVVVGPGEPGDKEPPAVVVAADPLEPRVAELEDELLKLRESMFPLELIRTRLRHLMEALGGLEDPQGANALSMGVLIEVFRSEPHRSDGGVLAICREKDAPVGGYVAFASAYYSAEERTCGLTVTLQRKGGSKGAVGVVLNTFDGGAAAGTDYTPVKNLRVEWADGDAADRTVKLHFIDDNFYEGDESFFLCITDVVPNPDTSFAIGLLDVCEVVIIDDDSRPAAGKSMAWGDVSVETDMPWDARDVARQLERPAALNEGRWKKQTQSKAKPMKQENLRTFLKNMIQAKRNADVVDDNTGAPRASMAEFYKFYIEYTYGTDTGPAKHASILRAMRQFYRLNTDPFVSMCTSMIGFYDPAPPRVSDLVCKISNMLSTSLISCHYSPPKFWSRFNGNLCLSPHEMRAIHGELYARNAKVKHKPFRLDPANEGLKSLQSLLLQEAGEPDENLDEEHALNLGNDETLQHAIVETSAKRGALRELVDSYASMDPVKGILMLDFEKFSGVMEVLDPHASEERRVHFYKKVLRLDTTVDLMSFAQRNKADKPSRAGGGGRGSVSSRRLKVMAPSSSSGGDTSGEEPTQGRGSSTGEAVGEGGATSGELLGTVPEDGEAEAVAVVADAPRLQVKNWSQAQKMAIAADDLANVMFDQLDFLFGTSCS